MHASERRPEVPDSLQLDRKAFRDNISCIDSAVKSFVNNKNTFHLPWHALKYRQRS